MKKIIKDTSGGRMMPLLGEVCINTEGVGEIEKGC